MKRILTILVMILTLSFSFSLTACGQKEDFSSLVFTDAVYEYDGKTKSLEVEGLEELSGYTVEYMFNDQKEPGTYRVLATIKNADGEVVHEMVAMLIINEKPHTHEFDGWESDATHHWHECECGEIDAKAAHTGGTATVTEKAKCEVCGASYGELKQEEHTHDFTGEYKSDATHHWHECSCGETDTKVAHSGGTATATEKAKCEVCGASYGELKQEEHTHDFTGEYESDATHHWHECSCGETDTKVAHSGGEATTTEKAVCEVCGASYGDFAVEITIGYVVEIGGVSYQLNENTSFAPEQGDTAVAEYMYLGLNVTAGEKLTLKLDGEEITKVGPSSSESNVDLDMLVVKTASDVAIYVKKYDDGGYSVWLEGNAGGSTGGDQGGSGEEQTAVYTVEINGIAHTLEVNTKATLKENQTGEYMVLGLEVETGDEVVFKKDGQAVVAGSEPQSETSINNIGEDNKVKTAGTVDLYFKTWQDGGYSHWMTGYQSSTGGDQGEDTPITPDPSGEIITIYFSAPNNAYWGEKTYVYFWPDGSDGDWPGVEMTYVETNEYGQKVFKIEVDLGQYQNAIFHNNNGWQTVDVKIAGSANNTGWYIINNDGNAVNSFIYGA